MSKKTYHIEIDSEHVRQIFVERLSDFIATLENALRSYSERNGSVIQPVRNSISVAKHSGLLLSMPAYSSSEDALATKIVTVYPENSKQGLPVVLSTILLFSSETGSLKAMVDGDSVTALRTAAVSAVATKYLAVKDAKILALLGAGTQAKSHFEILSIIHQLTEIRVWNIHENSAQKLVQVINSKGLNGKVCINAEDAVRDADIIVTATLSSTPVLSASWVKPGAHINAVGACVPDWQEIDSDLMNSATVYVDSREGAEAEAGDVILSKAEIYAEIGEVISGQKKAFREKTTVFKSLGMAIEDAVTADLIYKSFQQKQ